MDARVQAWAGVLCISMTEGGGWWDRSADPCMIMLDNLQLERLGAIMSKGVGTVRCKRSRGGGGGVRAGSVSFLVCLPVCEGEN